MKYFVISDIHSCYDEMIFALNNNGYDKNNPDHKIIFLGDAFDKGKEHLKTFLFFKELINDNKMIWILGNHDVELINVIKNKKYSRDCKDAPIEIAKYYNENVTDDPEKVSDVLIHNGVLDLLENKTVDYYELNNYIFTHGFIPTLNGKYDPNWRDVPSNKRNSLTIRKCNGIKMIRINNIKIPCKTLICGHVGAYFGHLIDQYPDLDIKSKEFNKIKNRFMKDYKNYETYISDDVINLDSNGYKTGFINVFVFER